MGTILPEEIEVVLHLTILMVLISHIVPIQEVEVILINIITEVTLVHEVVPTQDLGPRNVIGLFPQIRC